MRQELNLRGEAPVEKCSSEVVQFSCDACVWRSSTNSISVFRPVLPATSVYINHTFFSSVTVENIIGMLALTCTNFYFLQAGCTKLIIPDFMERQALLLFSAVGTGPETCAADDAGKKVWVFQWEKMSRSDRLITYEWKTAIFGKHSKEFRELYRAKRAPVFRTLLIVYLLLDSLIGCFCLCSIIANIAQRCVPMVHQKR